MTHRHRHRRCAQALAPIALTALLAAPLPALAQDLAWSGFATLGYAHSADAPGRYLRWIDSNGTFNADSVAALQLDARFDPSWSATVQLKAAPSVRADNRWSLRPAWAFLAWRPNDDWLLRAGRMRAPLYLYSEALDIGVAHSMARLPVEMYSLAPTNEFDGVSASYTRPSTLLPDSELTLDAYTGRTTATARFWLRDGAPPQLNPGAMFVSVDLAITGLIATLRSPRTTLRLGLHQAHTAQPGMATPVDYPFVPIGPGLGYYRMNDQLPGPPIETVPRIRNQLFTLGADHRFGDGWRLMAELARNQQFRTRLGSNTLGGYVALSKDIGAFTPYVSLGQLTTSAVQMNRYKRLTSNLLPAMVPGAAQINAAQRIGAETIYAADQTTWALGTAWRTPVGGTLKMEVASVHIGEVSRLIDVPSGQPSPRNQRFGTWTLSYSVAY